MSTSKLVKYSTVTAEIWVVSFISLSSLCSAANAASITNGGFEADLSGWTAFAEGFSPVESLPIESPPAGIFGPVRWFDTSGGVSPLSNSAILEPFEGESYAVTDHEESGSIVLYPDIPLEKGLQHTRPFARFAQSKRSFADSGSMSLGIPCCYQGPVQQFRVDLAPARFTDFFSPSPDTGILANIVAPVAEPFPVTGWNTTIFDLTPWASSTVRLPFREAAIGGNFQAGVDAVEIESVPEPSTTLGSVMLLGFGALMKRQYSKKRKKI